MKFAINAPVLSQVFTRARRSNTCSCKAARVIQGEISTGPKAVVKEVAFNGWTNHACAKDVTEFDTPEEANLIVRTVFEIECDLRRNPCVVKSSGSQGDFETRSRPHRSRRKNLFHKVVVAAAGDLLVDRLPGLHRAGYEPQQERR